MTAVLHIYDTSLTVDAAAMLKALRGNDRLACVGGHPPHGAPAPDDVVRQPWPWRLTAAGGLRALADQHDINLIHCWSADLADAAASAGRPAVVSLFRRPQRRQIRTLIAAATAGATFLTPSRHLADQLKAMGLPSKQTHAVAPSSSIERPSAGQRSAARAAFGLDGDEPVLLAPALGDTDDGPPLAQWAVGILRMMKVPVRLLLAGKGATVAKARTYCDYPGLAESLIPTDCRDMDQLLAAADIAVLANPAGVGLTLAAGAVAAGVAIVATDAGELGETFVHERTALLAPPETPRLLARNILRLIEDTELAARLTAEASRALAALANPPAMTNRLTEVYAQAAGQPA